MFSYFPFRTYVLPLLIIGSIFSLKGQEEKEQEAPEEQPITRYKGFKLEFGAPLTRLSFYEGGLLGVYKGRLLGIYDGGAVGIGLAYFAPQYYIHNNISVGTQFELDLVHEFITTTYMATGDYYFGNGAIRPSLGLGMGISSYVPEFVLSYSGPASITAWVLSPRFKLHLPWITLHSSYDINIGEDIPNSWRLGMAFTLFGKAKEEPKTPKEQIKAPKEEPKTPEEQTIKRYKGFKLELAIPFTRYVLYQGEGFGFGVAYLAPQYYIHNNISVGLQYEFDVSWNVGFSHSFMATGDYYFTNEKIRPSLGLGVGVNSVERKSSLVLSPRFKIHLPWGTFHNSYDINVEASSPHSFRFGMAFTLFGKKK